MTAPEVRTWPPAYDAEWRCVACNRHLARLSGDAYTKPNGEHGTLPASLKCPRCGHRNHCERIIVRTEYRRT